jgi:hypothetical protein
MSSAPDKTRQIKFTSSSVFRPIKRPTLSLSLLLVWQLWLAYLISFRSKFAVRNAFRAALAMASRRTITIKDGEKLRKMAASLQITLDELTYFGEHCRRAWSKTSRDLHGDGIGVD